eukprot:scaffold28155_cov83-Skeletonema_dohrnii-CCMP3373.AAC.1
MALPVSGHWWRGRPGAATRKLSPTCGLRVSLMTKSEASSKCMVDLFGCDGCGDYVNRSSRLQRVVRMKDVKQPPIKYASVPLSECSFHKDSDSYSGASCQAPPAARLRLLAESHGLA